MLGGFGKSSLDTNSGDALAIDDSVAVLYAIYTLKTNVIDALQNLIDQHGQFNLFNSVLGTVEVLIETDLMLLKPAVAGLGTALQGKTQVRTGLCGLSPASVR